MKRFWQSLFTNHSIKQVRRSSLGVESLEDRWAPTTANFPPIMYVPKEVIVSTTSQMPIEQQAAGATPPINSTGVLEHNGMGHATRALIDTADYLVGGSPEGGSSGGSLGAALEKAARQGAIGAAS